ncbi:unnamed protein product [Moneuplotes crassus]|uniref:Uncharacterized protein n=1 Tax=Euplotes crassus TaxID=5936 RepID=A0AAD1XL45_EUPCR|nr:unnamed protein product [Moneuplotes crassus]
MKKARMRVEHAGEQEKFIMDQISPTNIPPSGFKNNSEEIKEEYEESVSGSKTDEEFYQIDMLKSDLKSDTVTLNLSKSPRIQHQILNKNDDTISASKDPNEGQKLGELPAAKRLIFNSKNQEHRGDEGADSSPPQSFAALVRGKENATPNNGLINNKNRAEIFNTMPVLKENSTLSVSVMESERKTPNKLVERQEVIQVEVEDSGFDDFKSFEDQKDFDEYKKEDFNNYLNLKREEDSFDYESELSIPIENVDGHF